MAENLQMPSIKMSQVELNRTAIQVDETNKKIGKPDGVKSELNQDAFFKLLVTQLSHQDPTNPMEDREFISQMAQFSSLNYMQSMSHEMHNFISSNEASQAFNLLGKNVDALEPVTGRSITGEVSSVFFEAGKVLLNVDNRTIGIKDITAVYKKAEEGAN
jgi:flagellar basal-body rod modification protein FlgD